MLRNFSIGIRLLFVIFILLLAIAVLVVTINLTSQNVQEMDLKITRDLMYTGQKDKIKLGTQTMAVALAQALKGVDDRQRQHDIIKSFIQDYRFEEDKSGYYFTYIGTTIFMHPTLPQREGEDLGNTQDKNGVYYVKELYEAAKKGGGFVEFVFPKPPSMDIAPKLGYVEYISGTDIWLSTGVYIDDIETTLNALRNEASTKLKHTLTIIIGIIIGVILFILAPLCILIMRSITKPVKNIAVILKDISEGDLTKIIPETGKDEITALSRYFNLTLDKIKEMIIAIKNESVELSDLGNDLSSNMTKTAAAINRITANIQGIKGRVINQSSSVTETNATMEQVIANIDKLNNHVEYQSETISKRSAFIHAMVTNIDSVNQTLIKNLENVKNLKEASEVGRNGLQEVAADVQKIARESEGLLEINAVIENIASQTNLLSMNAAIEAAHAGEAGKGFAVVADEIRKLAENSSEQSKTIGTVLKKIKESMDKITKSTGNVLTRFESIDSGVNTVAEQEEIIRNAMEQQNEGSNQLLQGTSNLTNITQQVKTGSEEMLEGSKEVINESRNLEKITQEISGGMNEMASGADQVNIAVHNVNEMANKNRESINTLLGAVSRFKVK
jgi:methyl-accepting chemotaxis protein